MARESAFPDRQRSTAHLGHARTRRLRLLTGTLLIGAATEQSSGTEACNLAQMLIEGGCFPVGETAPAPFATTWCRAQAPATVSRVASGRLQLGRTRTSRKPGASATAIPQDQHDVRLATVWNLTHPPMSNHRCGKVLGDTSLGHGGDTPRKDGSGVHTNGCRPFSAMSKLAVEGACVRWPAVGDRGPSGPRPPWPTRAGFPVARGSAGQVRDPQARTTACLTAPRGRTPTWRRGWSWHSSGLRAILRYQPRWVRRGSHQTTALQHQSS